MSGSIPAGAGHLDAGRGLIGTGLDTEEALGPDWRGPQPNQRDPRNSAPL